MKRILTIIILLFSIPIFGQCDKDLIMYKQYQIETESDTISYHIYAKNGIGSVSGIFVFVQGSGAFPMFQIERNKEGLTMVSTIPFDLETIPEDYALVLVSKRGIPFCTKLNEKFDVPKVYYENEGIANRAERISKVIDHLTKTSVTNPKKVVVLGHSEGSDVVAKLGVINKKITHIGYWSGGGNTQFFDFMIFIRKDILAGKITEEQGLRKMDSLFFKFKEIMDKPESISDFWEDNTYRRWNYFSEPPIDNLLQIDVPIFVAIGSKDQAVPVESAYLIPIEFIRHKKNNLTFTVYPDLDHGFEKELKNGKFEDHWNDVFKEFLDWVNSNSSK